MAPLQAGSGWGEGRLLPVYFSITLHSGKSIRNVNGGVRNPEVALDYGGIHHNLGPCRGEGGADSEGTPPPTGNLVLTDRPLWNIPAFFPVTNLKNDLLSLQIHHHYRQEPRPYSGVDLEMENFLGKSSVSLSDFPLGSMRTWDQPVLFLHQDKGWHCLGNSSVRLRATGQNVWTSQERAAVGDRGPGPRPDTDLIPPEHPLPSIKGTRRRSATPVPSRGKVVWVEVLSARKLLIPQDDSFSAARYTKSAEGTATWVGSAAWFVEPRGRSIPTAVAGSRLPQLSLEVALGSTSVRCTPKDVEPSANPEFREQLCFAVNNECEETLCLYGLAEKGGATACLGWNSLRIDLLKRDVTATSWIPLWTSDEGPDYPEPRGEILVAVKSTGFGLNPADRPGSTMRSSSRREYVESPEPRARATISPSPLPPITNPTRAEIEPGPTSQKAQETELGTSSILAAPPAIDPAFKFGRELSDHGQMSNRSASTTREDPPYSPSPLPDPYPLAATPVSDFPPPSEDGSPCSSYPATPGSNHSGPLEQWPVGNAPFGADHLQPAPPKNSHQVHRNHRPIQAQSSNGYRREELSALRERMRKANWNWKSQLESNRRSRELSARSMWQQAHAEFPLPSG